MKERICEYIQHEVRFKPCMAPYSRRDELNASLASQDYIKQLIEVLRTAEEMESLENLHALCSLMQTICTSGSFFSLLNC